MQDAGVNQIISSPENYAAYLEVQGANPMYSAGNIALAMVQFPGISQIGTAERWKVLGRTVLDSEKSNGIQIFARGSFGKGYGIANAYDITQTFGREIAPVKVAEGSKEMESALTTVMNYSLVPIEIDHDLPEPAYYDHNKLVIAANPNFGEAETFAALATEVALSRIHNKGKNIHYTRKENELDAQSVSYLLCKRFGIECEMPDLSNLTDIYNGWTAPEIRQALSYIQDMSKQIGGSIDKSITPQPHSRGNMRRPAR